MAYNKETHTISIDGDPKQFERDMFRHFEEVTRQLAQQPNCPSEIAEQHEELKKANKALDDYDKLKIISAQAKALRKAQARPIPISKRIIERLQVLSKPTKVGLVFVVLWTIFVVYRTSASHYLFGSYLSRWDDGDFLVNWLAFPVVVAALFYGVRWALTDRRSTPTQQGNPLTEFENEIAIWPAHQGKIALLLIKATLVGDKEAIDKLTQDLTVEQFRKVIEVVKKMEKAST